VILDQNPDIIITIGQESHTTFRFPRKIRRFPLFELIFLFRTFRKRIRKGEYTIHCHIHLISDGFLRITLENLQNSQLSVIMKTNLSLSLKKKKEKENPKLDWWIQCDDLNAIHRIWMFGSRDLENHTYTLSTQGTSMTLTKDSLYKFAYNAVKKNVSEISMEFPSKSSEIWQIHTKVLVDLENKNPYGLHVTAKTSTSSVEAYKLLPLEL